MRLIITKNNLEIIYNLNKFIKNITYIAFSKLKYFNKYLKKQLTLVLILI